MKTLKYILFAFLLTSSLGLSTQTNDCLDFYWVGPPPPHENDFSNEDSVQIDTCKDSPTYNRLFIDGPYDVELLYNIIPRPELYPEGTIIKYSIDDILPKYSLAKQEFIDLKNEIGDFYFQDIHVNSADSTAFYKRQLLLIFENNLEIESTVERIRELSVVSSSGCSARFGWVTPVETHEENKHLVYNSELHSLVVNNQDFLTQDDLQIYNLSGIEVKKVKITQNTQTIDLSSLERGFYIVRFGSTIEKIIIQ